MEETNKPSQPPAQSPQEVPPHDQMPPSPSAQRNGFTPIGQLFKDAWHLMTKKFTKLLLTSVYGFLASLVLVVLLGLILVGSGIGAGGGAGLEALISNPAFLSTAALALFLYVILASILSIALQAAYLLVLAEPHEERSAFAILKGSFRFIIPVFVVGLLQGVIIFGSFFLFIIPALFVSVVLAFSVFAVLFEKKQGLAALRMSVGIIQQQFGAIVGRFALLIGAFFLSYVVIGMISSVSEDVADIMALVQFVVNYIGTWFALAYSYVVYKQARAGYDESKNVNMLWIWIVSGLGWLIGVFAIIALVNAVGSFSGSLLDLMMQEASKGQYEESTDFNWGADQNIQDDLDFEQMFGEDFERELQREFELQQQESGSEI